MAIITLSAGGREKLLQGRRREGKVSQIFSWQIIINFCKEKFYPNGVETGLSLSAPLLTRQTEHFSLSGGGFAAVRPRIFVGISFPRGCYSFMAVCSAGNVVAVVVAVSVFPPHQSLSLLLLSPGAFSSSLFMAKGEHYVNASGPSSVLNRENCERERRLLALALG